MLNNRYIIRKMTEQDLDQVMNIEKESFPTPWSRESYLSEIKNNWANYRVCDYEGQIAGYVGIWVVFEDAHITNVAVNKRFRSQGIGRDLMLEAEKIARDKKAQRILLEVRPSNIAALSMYKSLEYVPTGKRDKYYADNQEDAIIMTRYLF